MKAFRKSRLFSVVCILMALAVVTTHLGGGSIAASASDEMTFDIGTSEKSVTATLSASGALSISGVGDIQDYTAETAPFNAVRERIRSVEIGIGITSIGDYLFYNCENLGGELELPEKIFRIGEKAFSGDSAETAPKPEFVINKFVSTTVARDKDEVESSAPADESSAPEGNTSSEPASSVSSESSEVESAPSESSEVSEVSEVESSAPEVSQEESSSEAPAVESSAGEADLTPQAMTLLTTEEESHAVAAQAADEVSSEVSVVSEAPSETSSEVSSETASSELPREGTSTSSSSSESTSSETENDENQYKIETITEQEMGEEVFFPSESNAKRFFSCSAENNTFRAALKAASYTEAESIINVSFDCGEGSSASETVITRKMAVVGGVITLPEQLSEFYAPADTEIFDYSFGGWTESKDAANVVRAPASSFEVGGRTDLYFIASWNRLVLVNILKQYGDGFVRLSVPELSGYEISSCRWQTYVPAEGELLPANENSVAWQDIPNATETTYEYSYSGGENRLFRCVLEVVEQNDVALLDLLGIGETGETVTLSAVSASPTYEEITLKALKTESGQSMVSQSFYLPVSRAGSVYAVTAVSIEGEFNLVAPTGTAGAWALPEFAENQTADNTFALLAEPTDTQNLSSWTATSGLGGYVVGVSNGNANGTSDGNAEAASFVSTGYPVSTGAEKAEMTLTLIYDSSYASLSGGTVELTFNEYASEAEIGGETSYNTVIATVTLEGSEADYEQSSAVGAGRHFSEQSGASASVAGDSAVTASFTTWYHPDSMGTADPVLSLCSADGSAVSFPSGTDITLMSSHYSGNSYYFLTASGETAIPLSSLGYVGATGSEQVTEKLTFILDFSGAASYLPMGDYQLKLLHGAEQAIDTATLSDESDTAAQAAEASAENSAASFSITSGGAPSLDIGISSAAGEIFTLDVSIGLPSADTSYGDGAAVTLYLTDAEGNAADFPSKLDISGAENILSGADGSLGFELRSSGTHQLKLDFSNVTETMLSSGTYSIKAELRPKVGLQTEKSPSAQAVSEEVTLTLERETEAVRAVSVDIADASQRLADVSVEPAELKLNVSAQTESGDTVKLSIYKKTGSTPDESSYTRYEDGDAWCSAVSGISESVVITIPQGAESGTYRALFEVTDSSGAVVAQEPFNFIIK